MCTEVTECNTWLICWITSEIQKCSCWSIVSHFPKTPVKTDLCVMVLRENKSINVLMRNHTHPQYEFGLLISVCATYDHRKVSNPFSSSLSLCEEGRWVTVNGLRGRAMKWLNHTCYPEKKTTRERKWTQGQKWKKKPVKAAQILTLQSPNVTAGESQRVCLSMIFILNMHLIIICFKFRWVVGPGAFRWLIIK